jgi:hypothetical protein
MVEQKPPKVQRALSLSVPSVNGTKEKDRGQGPASKIPQGSGPSNSSKIATQDLQKKFVDEAKPRTPTLGKIKTMTLQQSSSFQEQRAQGSGVAVITPSRYISTPAKWADGVNGMCN